MGACHRPYLFKIACFTTLFHWFEPKIVLSTLKRPLKKVPFFSHHPLYTYVTSDVMSLVKNSVKKRCGNTASKIAVCHSKDCASAQWPAVIVLYEVWLRKEYVHCPD